MKVKQLSIEQAAKMMGKTPQWVRWGIQQGILPFGKAVKMRKHFSYYINATQFYNFLGVAEKKFLGGELNGNPYQ